MNEAAGRTYLGLFLVSLATMMNELLLTRIFSVTMWYHFAFLAISIAMFGLTAGAVVVFALPQRFQAERLPFHLGLFSLLFALFVPVTFLIDLWIPSILKSKLVLVSITYLITSVPFVFSGVAISLYLTRFPGQISRLYAADLAGAAVGCIVLILSLNWSDGPASVLLVSAIAATASILPFSDSRFRRMRKISSAFTLLLMVLVVTQFYLLKKESPLLQVKWVKGQKEAPALFERWNSYSRVKVVEDPGPGRVFGWGMSPVYSSPQKIKELKLDIDAGAATVITEFHGNLKDVEYLKFDATNVVHYIRPNADVAIIGVGGGRDVLSALAFNQKSVLGIEINQAILEALNGRFHEFSGQLDRNPKVKFAVDEARSHIARSSKRFDIIQASLIDTFAATAAGAFVLSENSLYTVEAWKMFMEHLNPGGILSVSRWYEETPIEMYRMTAIAQASLNRIGIQDTRQHIVVLAGGRSQSVPVGTILVGNSPFTQKDLDILREVCRKLNFFIALSPRFAVNSVFADLASGNEFWIPDLPLDLSAPTDDRPFFFYVVRFSEAFSERFRTFADPVFILALLLILVFALASIFIVIPLFFVRKREPANKILPLMAYFISIGFGFLLIEIAQMQRLIIFLGHPTYSLSVVLFTLLLSSGIGSFLTSRIVDQFRTRASTRLMILMVALTILGWITPPVARAMESSATEVRILTAVSMLFPAGIMMGMAFPIGMMLAAGKSPSFQAWLWGINGATSVCSSVVAIVISLTFGISMTFWVGVFAYCAAFLSFLAAVEPLRRRTTLQTV